MTLPSTIRIIEVGPRDGFQMESVFVPTELKVEVIDLVSSAGVPKIEATSFVHPEVIPQMADADEVLERIERLPGTTYSALVPNLRGMERAIAAAADGVRLVVCATETYNRENVGMSVDESVETFGEMVRRAEGNGLTVEAVVGVAFGCPFEGEVSEGRVLELARRLVALGADALSVADSIGVADPARVRRTMETLRDELPEIPLSLHLHDTRGLGLANAYAAMEVGVDAFDASIGGLGGCPITSVSSGNIATEDLVNMCHEMGVETGVDLDPLRRASRAMERFLERSLPSRILAVGTRRELFESPEPASSS